MVYQLDVSAEIKQGLEESEALLELKKMRAIKN